MQTILRFPGPDYMEEVKKLAYDYYAKTNNIIFSTYYQLDADNTVYDPNYISTYHKQGELSGRKFNKVFNMPMLFAKDATPIGLNSSENGLNFQDLQSSVVIDTVCGLTPHVGDVLVFNISNDYSSWEVTNVSKSGTFDVVYNMCDIKPIRFRPDFETVNILDTYIFIEYAKKIYKYTDGVNYNKCLKRLDDVIKFLNKSENFNHNLGYHTVNDRNCFPQIETMIFTHKKVGPPSRIYTGDEFDVDIPTNSILMLFCMPDKYDTSKSLLKRVVQMDKSNYINIKIGLWNCYYEWLLSDKGSSSLASFFYESLTDFDSATQYILNCLTSGTYTENTSSSVIGKLADEIMKFKYSTITNYLEQKLSTNLLEAAIEYCQVCKELYVLSEKVVTLK